MSKIICIVGPACSGKDTLVYRMGWRMVVSKTTRPRRKHEINHRDKHFLTDECKIREFLNNDLSPKHPDIVAYTRYDKNVYFALRQDLVEKDAYIIDPAGVRYMLNHYPKEEMVVLLVWAPWWKRLYRLYSREMSESGHFLKAVKYAVRRVLNDRKEFKKLRGIDIQVRVVT